MEMKLLGCGMKGLAILMSNSCSNDKKNPWLKASWSLKQPLGNWKGCVVGKHPEHKFNWGKANQDTCILGMIHSDISDLMPVTSMNWSRYLLTFIDDFSRYTWVFFLKNKSEVCEKFSELKALIENASGININILRYDNGGEYVSNYFLYIFSQVVFRSSIQFPTLPDKTE